MNIPISNTRPQSSQLFLEGLDKPNVENACGCLTLVRLSSCAARSRLEPSQRFYYPLEVIRLAERAPAS